MATWSDLAIENHKAAHGLIVEMLYRASVSRAYYAAYAAVTAKLVELPDIVRQFPPDRGNPSHKQIRGLISHLHRTGVNQQYVTQLKAMVARLQGGRNDADYIPGRSVSRLDAMDRLRDSAGVLQQLGIGV